MKHLISTLVLIVCGIFCTQFAFCDTIPTKGEWSIQDIRSVVPAPPTASIEGKVLTVNFVNPLADLTVKVTDNKTGKVVYEECIFRICSAKQVRYPECRKWRLYIVIHS